MPYSDGTMTPREYRRNRHICRDCGERDAYTENGRLLCAECQERQNERQRDLSPERKARKAESQKALKEARKAQGLCPICGKRPMSKGYKSCDVCRAAHRLEVQRSRRKQGTMSRDEAYDLGICVRCLNAPAVEGKKLCANCGEWWESVRNKSRVDNEFTRSIDAYWAEKKRGDTNGEV